MGRVYFDNNATTPLLPEVFDAMRAYFGERFGNASSIHHHGQETRAAVERARESIAELLGCRASEIVFTSGGTEADNLAIFGLAAAGDHVISSTIEHHAVLNSCKHVECLNGPGFYEIGIVVASIMELSDIIIVPFIDDERNILLAKVA